MAVDEDIFADVGSYVPPGSEVQPATRQTGGGEAKNYFDGLRAGEKGKDERPAPGAPTADEVDKLLKEAGVGKPRDRPPTPDILNPNKRKLGMALGVGGGEDDDYYGGGYDSDDDYGGGKQKAKGNKV
jgi:hypothetical protein